MRLLRWLSVLLCVASGLAESPKLGGDYSGVLGPLHLKLHVTVSASGSVQGTMDSVEQGANGLACSSFLRKDKALSFDVPSVGGKWRGTVSEDGSTLSGTWVQGREMPLVFRRDEPFTAAAKASRVDGIWLGTLEAGGAKLRLQLQVKSDKAGKEYCVLDSLDQGAMGLPCDNIQLKESRFSFEIPAVHGRWSGTLAADGKKLDGKWSQGSELPLVLVRQSAAIAAKLPDPPKYEAARAAVPIPELKAALDRDLAAALKDGALAPKSGGGVAIGVLQRGGRRVFAFGAANEDAIFEIGSITKTFTGLMLAQLVAQHKVKLDEPVRELLPPGTVAKPQGDEITLLDLATQHSGLPRMPDNFHPADPQDPYADYAAANLYQFLAKQGVGKPAATGFLYSNLGFGLLGQALANRAGKSYPALLRTEITEPLGLKDTVVTLSPEQEKRFAPGHTGPGQPAHPWKLDAMAGAGAIRSTADDMLTYLTAQLHPDSGTLGAALTMTHELRAESLPAMQIGLAWLFETKTGSYWHNGGTGGYSSYALFNPKEDYALVVLCNMAAGENGSFADRLGEHIAERISGKPAVTLLD